MPRIARWGNSLAIRIPKALTEQVGLKAGAVVELTIEGRTLVIRKVRPLTPKEAGR